MKNALTTSPQDPAKTHTNYISKTLMITVESIESAAADMETDKSMIAKRFMNLEKSSELYTLAIFLNQCAVMFLEAHQDQPGVNEKQIELRRKIGIPVLGKVAHQ